MVNIHVPGSKSITNRALVCAFLSKTPLKLKNILASDDTFYMQEGLKKLKPLFSRTHDKSDTQPLQIFCGNSGTTVRFLSAVAALQSHPVIITGNARMQKRPIEDLVFALRQLGADVYTQRKNGCPPIFIRGPLRGGICTVNGKKSSQFLSALLLAAPYAQHDVTIKVQGKLLSKPYIDMTLRVMQSFGVSVQHKNHRTFIVKKKVYGGRAAPYIIEGDASSATYFWALSALTGTPVHIPNIPRNSIQGDAQFKKLIRTMGVGVPLKPLGAVDMSDMPDAALTGAILCAFSDGVSTLTGLENLALKECDRLTAMTNEFSKIGAEVTQLKDGWKIRGQPQKLHASARAIDTYDDHRIAMCFGVVQKLIPSLKIENKGCVKKTYPHFFKDLKKIPAPRNIIITGMRGSGKSTLGKALAKRLKRRFYDVDRLIEAREGKRVARIVQEKGWNYFRECEQKVTHSLECLTNAVISTGGGTFIDKENAAILKKHGIIILLTDTISNLEKRIQQSHHRPALTSQKSVHAELQEIWQARKKKYYTVADVVIKRTMLTRDIATIIRKLKEYAL